MAFESSFLSLCPRIRATPDALVASTSTLACFLSLGVSRRHVTVDRAAGHVTIDRRLCWFMSRSHTLPFPQIMAITYGYEDVAFWSSLSTSHDGMDVFLVGLLLADREEVPLFRFMGDGTFTNDGPWPDWWYWEEYLMDWCGTQQRESQLFAQLLSKMIGVPIAPSTLTPD